MSSPAGNPLSSPLLPDGDPRRAAVPVRRRDPSSFPMLVPRARPAPGSEERRGRPGVFVIDADSQRRSETVTLLRALPGLEIVGDDSGSADAVSEVVRALPHVCVVAASVRAGSTPRFVEAVERALPATELVRGPVGVAAGKLWQSDAGRARWETAMVDLVGSVLRAVGLPVEPAEGVVRDRLREMTSRRRRVPSGVR